MGKTSFATLQETKKNNSQPAKNLITCVPYRDKILESIVARPGSPVRIDNQPPIPARPADTHPGQERCIVAIDRPVNVHVHLPGVRCPACEYLEMANMQDEFARMEFSAAFMMWLETKNSIGERTHRDYLQYGDALCAFFQSLQLFHINAGAVRGYQAWRWKRSPDGEH